MPRRKNGEGTIYRRCYRYGGGCCLWVGELTLGYEGGRRIKKTYASRDLATLQRALNNGKFIIDNVNAADGTGFISGLPFDCDDKGYTIASWVSYWLDTYKRPTIKLSTLERYMLVFSHINKNIGSLRLSAVDADVIQRFYNGLAALGLSMCSIKKAHFILNPAFAAAVNRGYMLKNPCIGAVIPKTASRRALALSADEQAAFESACSRSVYGDLFRFLLNTGLRVGEALALEWSDVDLGGKLISVNKTASRLKGKTVISTTKTAAGVRSVPMGATVVSLLSRRLENSAVKTARLVRRWSSRPRTAR